MQKVHSLTKPQKRILSQAPNDNIVIGNGTAMRMLEILGYVGPLSPAGGHNCSAELSEKGQQANATLRR